jgi:hypothetical protein
MKEIIDVNVSFDTSFEDIELLRAEMENFVRSPENSRDFQPDVAIGVGGVGDLDKLTLKIAIKHKSNWHNEVVRATRRSKFMCALALALKKIPINGPGGGGDPLGGPSNPTYSVAVTDEFAVSAREKSEKEKEAKKLVNQKTEQAPANAPDTETEQRAAEQLNAASPVVEALETWGYNNSLGPRDSVSHRERTADASAARFGLPSTRESQRGRRKAGEALPPGALSDDGMPGIQLTRTSTSSRRGEGSFDVERQASVGRAPTVTRYAGWTAYDAQTGGAGPGPSAMASPPQPGLDLIPESPGFAVQQPGSPPQSVPPSRIPTVGARQRGATVGGQQQQQPQQQQQQQQQQQPQQPQPQQQFGLQQPPQAPQPSGPSQGGYHPRF